MSIDLVISAVSVHANVMSDGLGFTEKKEFVYSKLC